MKITKLTTLIAALLGVFPAWCYVPFIEEGKVWTYIHYYERWDVDNVSAVNKKFDGKITFNGVEYDCFVEYERFVYPDGLSSTPTDPVRIEGPDRNVTYFREEGERLYCLAWDTGGPVTNLKQDDDCNPKIREVVAMDFSLSDGDEFPDGLFVDWDCIPKYVKYQEPLLYGDMAFRCYVAVDEYGDEGFVPRLCEGIGDPRSFFPFTPLYYDTSMSRKELQSVTTKDGKTLYKNYDIGSGIPTTSHDATMGILIENGVLKISVRDCSEAVLTVSDLSGKMLGRLSVADGDVIPVSSLSPGVYVAALTGYGHALVYRKFIVR